MNSSAHNLDTSPARAVVRETWTSCASAAAEKSLVRLISAEARRAAITSKFTDDGSAGLIKCESLRVSF